ncbi:MAG: DUF1622 domain-containing protein [Patescibacteria group bacterium]|jgi:uncharacterized membrane protein
MEILIIDILNFLLNLVGAAIIVFGAGEALVRLVTQRPAPLQLPQLPLLENLRIAFGQRIIFGLEFLVAADILRTLESRTLSDLAQLGILVAIRTTLSFFLNHETRHAHTRVMGGLAQATQRKPKKSGRKR